MFIRKSLHNKIVKAKEKEITELNNKVNRQEESIKELRTEIEDEHLENYRHHRKLLAIERLLKEQDYNSVENLKNKIRTILNKKELDRLENISSSKKSYKNI